MGVLDDLLKKTKEAARKNAKTRAAGKKKKKKASAEKKQTEQKRSFTQTRNIDRVRGSRKTTSAPSSKPEEEKKREASTAAWDKFGRSPEGSGFRESMRPVEEEKRNVDPVALQGNTGRTREELERVATQRELERNPIDDGRPARLPDPRRVNTNVKNLTYMPEARYASGGSGRTKEELDRRDSMNELAQMTPEEWLKIQMDAAETRNKGKGVGPMAVPDPAIDKEFNFTNDGMRSEMAKNANAIIANWQYIPEDQQVQYATYLLQAYGVNDKTRDIVMGTFRSASAKDKLDMLEEAVYILGDNNSYVREMQRAIEADPTTAQGMQEKHYDDTHETISIRNEDGTYRDVEVRDNSHQQEVINRGLQKNAINEYRTYQEQQHLIDQYIDRGHYSRSDALKAQMASGVQSWLWDMYDAGAFWVTGQLQNGQEGIEFTKPGDNIKTLRDEGIGAFLVGTVSNRLRDIYNFIGIPAALFSKAVLSPEDVDFIERQLFSVGGKWRDEIARQDMIYQSSDLDPASKFMTEAIRGTVEMVPGIVASVVATPAAGLAVFGAKAGGASARDAYEQGATLDEAVQYGLTVGTAEVVTEKLFMGFGFMGKGIIAPTLRKVIPEERILTGTTRRILEESGFMNSTSFRVLRGVAASGGEATEEMIMEIVSPYIERTTYNPEAMDATFKEVLYAGGLGAVIGGILGIPVMISNVANEANRKKAYDEIVDDFRNQKIAQLNEAVEAGYMTEDEAKATLNEINDTLNGVGSLNVSDVAPEEKVAGEALDTVYDTYEEAKKAMMQEARTKKDGEEISAKYIDNGVVKTFTTTAKGGTLGLGRSTEAGKEYQRIAQAKTVTERSGYQLNVKEEIIKEVSSLSKAIGREVEFYRNDDASDHGYMDKKTGKIYINAGSSQSAARSVIAHELTHQMENTAGWSKLVELMKKHYGSSYESRRQERIDAYEAFGKPLKVDKTRKTYDEADQELVAMFVEEKLLTDADTIREVVNTDKTLAQKIIAWINKVIQKLAGNKEQKMLVEARDLWNQALTEEQAHTGKDYIQYEGATIAVDAGAEIRFSQGKNNEMMKAAEKYNEEHHLVDTAELEQAKKDREYISKTYNKHFIADSMTEEDASPIQKNGSYGLSVENTSICSRSLIMESMVERIAKKFGRPLQNEEAIVVASELRDYTGDQAECLYCYQTNAKRAYENGLAVYLRQRESVISRFKSGMDDELNYRIMMEYNFTKNQWTKKDSPDARDRFNTFIKIAKGEVKAVPALYMANTRVLKMQVKNPANSPEFIKQLKQAEGYAQGASRAHARIYFAVYEGQILEISQDVIDRLNSEYGLRMFSYSDFSLAFLLENMQMVTDASVVGLQVLSYTKNTDFVEIFAGTDMAINMSLAGFSDGKGGYICDGMQSMEWEQAKKYREQYPYVGTVYVAFTDEEVVWAVNQDWIDTVIPFHISGGSGMMQRYQGWKNYSSVQSESKLDGWDENKHKAALYPTDHQNNKEEYLRLCKENHLRPKFAKFLTDPRTKDNYMKLVNETRVPPSEMTPVRPVFNLENVDAMYERFTEEGGYGSFGGKTEETLEKIAEDIYQKVLTEAPEVLKKSKSQPSPAKQRNDNYIQAVVRGNMETAHRLMEEAANDSMKSSKVRDEDGNLIYLYHGTDADFSVFDTDKNGGKNGLVEGFGIYTTDSEKVAESYGNRKMKLFANIKKPATSTSKTIKKPTLVKLIKDTCEKQANEMVREDGYDNINDALRDTWISNYVFTYDMPIANAYEEVATIILDANDNDMDIIREVMAGMSIRDYSDANKFYKNSLMPVTKIDGFITEWTNDSTGEKSKIVIPFISNQLKSAETVTRDDAGNIIPLTKRFKQKNDDIRWSVGEKDAEYMEAVESGDMGTAQRLVREAAIIAGFTSPMLHHGTKQFGFTQLKTADLEAFDWSPFFATSDPKVAESYSGPTNVRRIKDAGENNFDKMSDEELLVYLKELTGEEYNILPSEKREEYIEECRRKIRLLVHQVTDIVLKRNPLRKDANAFRYTAEAAKEQLRIMSTTNSRAELEASFADYVEIVSNLEDKYGLSIADSDKIMPSSIRGTLSRLSDLVENESMFEQDGYLFTPQEIRSELNGNAGIYDFYANLEGMFDIDGKGKRWNQIDGKLIGKNGMVKTRDVALYARDNGYTGVIIRNIEDWGGQNDYSEASDVYIFFEPASQVKSADPITYDENDNIIPLSERFNEENNDIRWSVGSRTKSFERGKKAGIKEQQRKQLQADRQNLSVYDKLAKQRTKDERKDAEATMRMHDKLIESVRKEEKKLSNEDKKKLQKLYKSKEKDWNKELKRQASEFKKEQRNAKKNLDSVIKQAEKERKDLERKLTAPQKKEMQKKQKDLDKARREERIRTAYNEYKRNSKPSEGSIESIYAKSKNARSLAAQMRRDIIKKIVELGKFSNTNGMVVLDENGMEIAAQNLETGEWDVSKSKNTYTPPFGLTLLAEKEGMDKDVFYTIYSKIAELRSAKDENGTRLHGKKDVLEYISMLDLPVKQKNFLYFDVAKYPYTKMPTFLAGGSIKEKSGNKRGGIIEAVDNIALDMFRGTVKDSQVFTSEDDTVQIQNEDLLNIADIVFGKEQSEEKEDFIYYLTETVLNYATQMENIRLIEKTKLLTNKPKEKNDIKAQVLNAYRESKKLFIAEGEAFERMSDKMDDILITARYYAAKKAPAIANEMIFGKTQRDLKGEYKGKSLYEIFKPIFRADEKAKNDKLMTELTELVNCRHDIYRMRNGKGYTNYSIEECEEIVARISKEHPELLKAADELADYGRNLLRMCVESGRISQADYDYFTTKYPYYVPTFRVRSNEFIDRKGNVVRRDSKVIRTSKGGNEDVLPLFDQFVHRTQEIVKACKKNQLATEMVRHINVPGMEEYISEVRVAENQENKDSSIADIGNIEDVGIARREDGMGNVIPWYSNGKKYDIVVRDKNLLYGWDRINYRREETSIETALRKMNNIRRGVLTQYSLTFWITNSFKDTQDMYLYNQHAQWLPVYHTIAAKTMFGGTTGVSKEAEERLQEYLSFGMSHASIFEYDNTTAGRRSKKTRAKEALLKPLELLDTLNFMTEQTPRFAVYMETYERLKEKQYKKGGNTLTDEEIKTIAMYRAEDATLNFGRSGTVVKYMNTYGFTFLNAGVQGMDRFRRMFVQVKDKDKKAMFINVVGLLMKMELFGVTGGVILSLLYGGDDEWSEALREFLYGENADKVKQEFEEMDDYQKLNYYPINIGGVWIKIPRGRLSAFLFGPMYYGEKVHDGEMDMKELVKAQLDLASETILFSNPVTNNIAGPFIDVMLRNKDHWGNPIVSEYEDMGEGFHYLEYDEETTDLAIAVADALRFWDLSPKKMDYIIEQYLGSYSDLIMPFLSKGQNIGDMAMDMLMSLAGKFYIDPTSNNRLAGDYYDLKEEYENIANASDGDSPYAVAVKFFNEDTEQLKYLRDQIKAINADTTISRRERLDEIAKLKEQMNIIYRDGVTGAEGILAYAMENYTPGADVNELYDAWIRDNMSAEWRVAHFNDTEMKRYNKITNAGCSSDNAVKAMDALAVLKPLDGESSVSDYQQVEAIAKLKLPAEEEVGAMAAVFNEKGYAKYTSMTPYGVTAQTWLDFEDALKEADKNNNGNGYYDNDEKQAALDSINVSNSVRAVLWQSKDGKLGSTTYDTAWKAGRNPYDSGVASKMIDDYMAKIAGMEEEEEEKQYLPLSADYRISGEYGTDRGDHIHSGIDLAIPEGSDVHAVMSGTVSFAGWKGGYGYRVVIDHPDGTQTAYSHLSDIGVKVGDDVDAGTVVALSGNTGYSTGPHLHFEVIEGGEYVNPEQYYDFGNGLKADSDDNYVSQMSAVSGGYSGGGGGGGSSRNASTSSPGSRSSQVASNRRSGSGIYLPTASGSSVGRSGRSSSVAGMSTSTPTYGTRGVYLPKASDYTSGGSSIRSSVATTQRTGRTGGSFWNENILS